MSYHFELPLPTVLFISSHEACVISPWVVSIENLSLKPERFSSLQSSWWYDREVFPPTPIFYFGSEMYSYQCIINTKDTWLVPISVQTPGWLGWIYFWPMGHCSFWMQIPYWFLQPDWPRLDTLEFIKQICEKENNTSCFKAFFFITGQNTSTQVFKCPPHQTWWQLLS